VIERYILINLNTNNLKEKTMNRNKILIGSLALIAVLAISAFSGLAVFRANASHEAGVADLKKLDAADISAFRWIAMAEFYTANSDLRVPANVDRTTLDAGDISAYRWNAMGEFYAAQNETHDSVSADLTTLTAEDISAYRWNAMGKFYAAQNELKNTQDHFTSPGP
jgi:hypothetical protein